MPRVEARTFKDFPMQRNIIEKVVERRIGPESDNPPPGWRWDYRHLAEDLVQETLPAPGLKSSHLGRLPEWYWDNGPPEGKTRESLKVEEVLPLFRKERDRWVPQIHRGPVNIHRDFQYLFSDDSVVETLSWSSVDVGQRSTHTLSRDLRANSPISACIYRRVEGENLPWRNYVRRQRFTGLLDSSGSERLTREGDTIYWSAVDTTKSEFVSYVYDDSVRLIFNKHAGETITSTSAITELDDFNDLEYLGDASGEDSQKLTSKYYPLSDDAYLEVYVVDTSADTWQQYTVVSSFTGANQVKVDTDLGILTFGSVSSGGTPPSIGQAVYLRYRTVPRIEYEEDGYGNHLSAVDADVNPLGQVLNRGFVVLSRGESDIAEITLETTKPVYGGTQDSYGPVYVGSDYAPLIATVYSSSGEVVPNVEVTFNLLSTPFFGSLAGFGNRLQKRTAHDGTARTSYIPPVSADDLGVYAFSVSGGNTITVGRDIYFDDAQDVYTYHVLKDDPVVGKAGADTAAGEVEWNAGPPNGRKVVLYKWSTSAINPVSGSLGAYVPIRPASITDGNVLTYSDTLESPDPSSSSTNLGAYWLVSDRYMVVQAVAYSPRYNRTIYSNQMSLRVALPDYMKGSYVNDSLQEIPFGWRLTGAGYDVASAVDGATYITINPVAGPYPIVDIIGGETWDYTDDFWPYGAYPGSGEVIAPFALLSLSWNIVV